MATKKDSTTVIDLPEIKLRTATLKIIGDTPLICHAWSKKAKLEMMSKHLKKAAQAKEARRPHVEFADSLYWLTEKPNLDDLDDDEARQILAEVIPQSKFGFPALAFKAAALTAGFQQGALARNAGTGTLARTTARGAFRVIGNEFAVIEGLPTPREDIVRIGGATSKVPQVCYRAEFKSWSTELDIQYSANVITIEQIANLFMLGGLAIGVGDWRPEKNGTFGTFHIAHN